MRTETNYHNLKNRCSFCGHRIDMHGPKGCVVSTSEYKDKVEYPHPCRCNGIK